MKRPLAFLILMAVSFNFARATQPIPFADTRHYLWITFFNDPELEFDNDGHAHITNENVSITVEESRPRANSFKYDLWIYKLDNTSETLSVNGTTQAVNENVRA